MMSIQSDMDTLRPFIGVQQKHCLASLLRGEEHAAYVEIVTRLAETVRTMPKTYEQDGLGDQAVVHLHYFLGGCDWWIMEKDVGTPEDPGQHQAFGLASVLSCKWAYITAVCPAAMRARWIFSRMACPSLCQR